MSAVFNHEGVLLDYGDPGRRHPHHDQRKAQPSDRERIALLKASRELAVLEIIFNHLDLSGIAQTRLTDAMNVIYDALHLKRPRLGM
jgi:hypothetical protein